MRRGAVPWGRRATIGWLLAALALGSASCHRSALHARAAVAAPATVPGGSTTEPPPPGGPMAARALITHGPRDRPRVALTFDADMTPAVFRALRALRTGKVRTWYDPSIVEQLRATHTPATVFLTGLWTQSYPDVGRSLAPDPLFELGNHTVDHAAWKMPCFRLTPVASSSAKRAEVRDAATEIESVSGISPRYFRFPGGCQSADDVKLVASEGEQPVGWDVASGDAFQPNPAIVVANVLRDTKPGSIIAMHLMGPPNAPATARALVQILPELRQRGFEFVRLSTLLGASPTGSLMPPQPARTAMPG